MANPYRTYRAALDPEAEADPRREPVVDGDTYHLKMDTGPNDRKHVCTRLRDIDTAEVFGVAHDSVSFRQGSQQHQFVKGWFEAAANTATGTDIAQWPLEIECHGIDKYGRWLVSVKRRSDGEWLAERLDEEFPSLSTEG